MTTQQLLQKQLEQLQSLECLLQQEKEVIQQHKPDALLNVSEEKKQLLQAIEKLDASIVAIDSFKAEKDAGVHEQALQAINDTLERCKELNNINGQIINQSQMAVERLKNNLLESRSKSTMTYDSKGKTQGGLSTLGIKA